MGLQFVGGPYDGRQIDGDLIQAHAHSVPVSGDLGTRLFVLLPEAPDVWDSLVRGKQTEANGLFTYERVQHAGEAIFVAAPGGLDRARAEASLTVHPRAAPALDSLSSEDRRRVIDAIVSLGRTTPEQWPQEKVSRLAEDRQLYVLRVPPDLRAFLQVLEGGRLELRDLVREEALQLFREATVA